MKNKSRILLFVILFLMLVGCDRITKNIAKEHLKGRGSISYFYDTFRLDYVENTGAFLSLGADLPETVNFWIFSILPLIMLIGLAVYLILKRDEIILPAYVALIMILSGGLSNIVDRILFDRHVTDFLNVGVGSLRTGIFNLADMYVTFGAILLFFYLNKNPKKQSSEKSESSQNTDTAKRTD